MNAHMPLLASKKSLVQRTLNLEVLRPSPYSKYYYDYFCYSIELYERMYAATDKVELEARERAMNIQEVVEIVENEHLKGSNRLEQAINLYSKLGYVEKMYKI